MKNSRAIHLTAGVLLLLALFNFSCGNNPPNTDGNNGSRRSSPTPINKGTATPSVSPTPEAGKDITDVTGSNVDNSVANIDTAMIFKVSNQVELKSKDAADFVRILSGLFRGGDILRVGDQAVAWVSCPDNHICPLQKGEYTECCHVSCADGIDLGPPPTEAPRSMMRRYDLPADDQQRFATAENKIRGLGTDDITQQYLIAYLYSCWKLQEADQEVEKLSIKLKDPSAPQRLDKLYAPLIRRTGDLYRKIDQPTKAVEHYRQAIDIAPRVNDEKEKAAAHASLGQLYEARGEKKEALENLKQATTIYKNQGDNKKSEDIKRAMMRVQKVTQ